MADLHRVAVYGTLRRGGHNNPLLADQEFLGNTELSSPLALHTSGSLPFVVPKPNETHRLVVDVYDVDSTALERLDRLEGHPNWYKRTQVPTPLGKAWVYVIPPHKAEDNLRYIQSGDWHGAT